MEDAYFTSFSDAEILAHAALEAKAGQTGGVAAVGAIRPGLWADLIGIDTANPVMAGRAGDQMLDSQIFAGDDRLVREVWSAGRHVVTEGRHLDRDRIIADYLATIARLQDRM